MTSPLRTFSTVLAGVVVFVSAVVAKTYRVTVAATDVDRAIQVVELELPADAEGLVGARGDDGAMLPLQMAENGVAWFIVPVQRAGEALTFTLVEGELASKGVDVKRASGTLQLSVGGRPALAYQMDKDALPRPDIKPEYKRAGYLHPVYTPSGTIVTDDYPAQHVHHHGIWMPWTKTSFQGRSPDFWNMGAKTGTVEFVEIDRTWSGSVHGGFVARHRFVDLSAPSPVVALHETWEVTAYDVPGATEADTRVSLANQADKNREPGGRDTLVRVFDLVSTQTCATNDPLILPQYHYGGLGYRGRGEWFGKDKAMFLTSEGETDRVKANHQRMRWVRISGAVDGGVAAFAVLGHPANFRAPQPVRVHPKEPYVSFTPSQLGEWSIEPGKPYVARYRFVAADSPPDRARLDALWNGYATSAVVKLEVAP